MTAQAIGVHHIACALKTHTINKMQPIKHRNDSSGVCCLFFEVEGGLGVEKDLKRLNHSIFSSVHQKGVTTLSAITGQFAEGFRWIKPDRAY